MQQNFSKEDVLLDEAQLTQQTKEFKMFTNMKNKTKNLIYKVVLTVAGVVLLVACEKNEAADPKQEGIKQTKAKITQTEKNFRKNLELAKTTPSNIAIAFNATLKDNAEKEGVYPMKNALDSATAAIPTGKYLMTSKYTNPENNEKMVISADSLVYLIT